MKVMIIGANGTIGKRVVEFLEKDNEILKVGKTSGEYQVDISDAASVKRLFERTGKIDAVVNASGDVAFAPLSELNPDHWEVGLRSKFMGQVNLV